MTPSALSNELLPCPFCGYALSIDEGLCFADTDEFGEPMLPRYTGVCCPGCAVFVAIDPADPTKTAAIAAWNQRSPALITELQSYRSEGVTVKDLEWREIEMHTGVVRWFGNGISTNLYVISETSAKTYWLSAYENSVGTFGTLEAAQAAAQLDYATRIKSALSHSTERAETIEGWQPIEAAPLDGKHCILAIPEPGGFIYSVQGAYQGGQWNAVHRDDVKPLAWMPNVLLPDHLRQPDPPRALNPIDGGGQ